MAQDNLISIEFNAADLGGLDNALTTIETILIGKVVNLTAEERKQYGKINNKRENWVTKVRNYITQKPEIKPLSLDLLEHDKDLAARTAIFPRLNRILAIMMPCRIPPCCSALICMITHLRFMVM